MIRVTRPPAQNRESPIYDGCVGSLERRVGHEVVLAGGPEQGGNTMINGW
jgi:hypothetical protein